MNGTEEASYILVSSCISTCTPLLVAHLILSSIIAKYRSFGDDLSSPTESSKFNTLQCTLDIVRSVLRQYWLAQSNLTGTLQVASDLISLQETHSSHVQSSYGSLV